MVTAVLAFVAAAGATAGIALLLPRAGPRGVDPPGTAPEPSGPPHPSRGARLLLALASAGRLLRPPGAPRDLGARIEAAGRPAGLGVRDVMAAKIAAAALGGGAALPLAALAPGRLGLLLGPLGAVSGFLAPDLWLARIAAERARRVRRDLPALLDMLRVTIGAGGSLTTALRSVGERTSGPLAREWRVVADEVTLGVPLRDALQALVSRLPQPEIRAFVAALERSRRHGAPLGETLDAQARAARLTLARRIREDAARAGPKIQLVVALLLVPSVLLLVAAALLSAFLDGDRGALAV